MKWYKGQSRRCIRARGRHRIYEVSGYETTDSSKAFVVTKGDPHSDMHEGLFKTALLATSFCEEKESHAGEKKEISTRKEEIHEELMSAVGTQNFINGE